MALVTYKRATFDYEILDSYEAGLELLGTEVKSLRHNHGKLEGSHITIRGGEAFLINAEIPPFQAVNARKDYEAKRNRRLLLSKKEIFELEDVEHQKGLTIIPLEIYSKGRKLKLKIATVRGKKKFDKRESIKKREHERDIGREIKVRR